MNNQDLNPGPSDPAKQHFVDASLEELARLGHDPDAVFLDQMDGLLDKVDLETNQKNSKVTKMPCHAKRANQNKILWVSGAGAALLFVGLFTIQHFSKEVTLDATTSLRETREVSNPMILADNGKKEVVATPTTSPKDEFLIAKVDPKKPSVDASGSPGEISVGYDTNYLFQGARSDQSSLQKKLDQTEQLGAGGYAITRGFSEKVVPSQATQLSPALSSHYGDESNLYDSIRLSEVKGNTDFAYPDAVAIKPSGPDLNRNVSGNLSTGIAATDSTLDLTQTPQANSNWNSYYLNSALPNAQNSPATVTPYLGYNGTLDTGPVESSKNSNDVLHGGVSLSVDFGSPEEPTNLSKTKPVSAPASMVATASPKPSVTSGTTDFGIAGKMYKLPAPLFGRTAKTLSRGTVVVNGASITKDQVDEALRGKVQLFLLNNEDTLAETDAKQQIREMEETALEQVIDEKLILGEFKKMGGKVESKYVDQTMDQLITKRFAGNREAFVAELAKNNLSLDSFRKIQADQIAVQAMLAKQLKGNSKPKRDKELADQNYNQWITRLREEAIIQVVPPAPPKPAPSAERYGQLVDNPFASPLKDPLSTFSVDVDTASYSNIRRLISNGHTVPADSVRIEEMINYFSYDYPQPEGEHPFAFAIETAQCPWNENHQLMRVGIQGKKMNRDQRPPANLVFLLDVSGSMSPANKLPLVRKSMGLLIEELTDQDTISIVVYAGAEGLCLPPTSGNQKKKILDTLDNLSAGGSTNGGAGIQLAYKLARENFKKDGINRVILCTDGDFNVGKTKQGELVNLVEKRAQSGTFLSVLGFGSGNINDSMLEAITNKGNGNYFYIDSLKEGRKVLLQDLMSTLVTIAKDVKIQIEFNPKHVQHYRLIGYANRILKPEDFTNDKVDAGEIGAGHSVTALYEIVPAGAPPIQRLMSNLRYQQPIEPEPPKMKLIESDELCTLKLRYKLPAGDKSIPMEQPVNYKTREWQDASDDYQFSTAVALWGMLLRDSEFAGQGNLKQVLELAKDGQGADPFGRRAEFIQLLNR